TLRTERASDELRRCCGAPRWVEAMMAGRPYATPHALLDAADKAWWGLGASDWQAAFACHPAIGAKADSGHQDARGEALSHAEQAGTAADSKATKKGLGDGNAAYRDRFGYTYIVCATGRSGEEMLDDLSRRLGNSPENEVRVAAGEQIKITHLRLEKLLKG
ncbi:MAG TPA: 2-oxo-4-hydroxy-4-carboxy-5-ureidoimidazoline decarboxylase, partial [Candidatus Xenobia bacterium]